MWAEFCKQDDDLRVEYEIYESANGHEMQAV